MPDCAVTDDRAVKIYKVEFMLFGQDSRGVHGCEITSYCSVYGQSDPVSEAMQLVEKGWREKIGAGMVKELGGLRNLRFSFLNVSFVCPLDFSGLIMTREQIREFERTLDAHEAKKKATAERN